MRPERTEVEGGMDEGREESMDEKVVGWMGGWISGDMDGGKDKWICEESVEQWMVRRRAIQLSECMD